MVSRRVTFMLDDPLAEQARKLGINISAATREGVGAAVRAAMADADRVAYERRPERADPVWQEMEAWVEG